ncbi:IMP dehydrogenase [Patescibacteria group bacterium]|nr:MAG: IMP dehydrogenase [Patescibacteria group bacterium]
MRETLTFDDVLLVPQKSDVLPKDAHLTSFLTHEIKLNLPFLSAPMDTVTEHGMAIALALSGGLGIIHKNLSLEQQVAEVRCVKRFENGFIENPVTVKPDDKILKVDKIKSELGFKKVPVCDEGGRLVGLISDVDYYMPDDAEAPVRERMRPLGELKIAVGKIELDEANRLLRMFRLKTLCVVDESGKLASIVTRKDLEKNQTYPLACKNKHKQLRVGAAIGAGEFALARADALVAAGADALVIDTAHGHSEGVLETLRRVKQKYPYQPVLAGNIATGAAARDLIEAGADAIKVGIGPGSICTTRVVSGVGMPQLTAIMDVAETVRAMGSQTPLIADGGIKNSGDIVKALAAGASSVMMGNMFAGTDEAPGRVEFLNGRMYKVYRGMGSLEAMDRGSKDRYGQCDVSEKNKLVPEGVSGRVPYKGHVARIIFQLAGGVKSGMGYLGARTIPALQQKAEFIKISSSGVRENHPHDLLSFDAAPNYRADE